MRDEETERQRGGKNERHSISLTPSRYKKFGSFGGGTSQLDLILQELQKGAHRYFVRYSGKSDETRYALKGNASKLLGGFEV